MAQIKFIEQLKQLWLRLTPRQRLIVGGGTVASIVLLSVLTHLLATPDMKPLMVGLEPADSQAIASNLTAKKIAYQLTADGKGINVPADQLDAARLAVASDGPTHSGRLGFELFDKVSWGETEFDEKVNYQRALEGELERTIATLGDVKSARVHLVLPHTSVFLDRERGAKASVTLRLRRSSLSQDQLESISRLVSGAVDNLAPGDVAIIDADSNQSLGKKSAGLEGREIEEELSKRLVATLSPAVGQDNLRASVNVEYDLTTSEESQDKYDPTVSAVLTSQKSSEQTSAGDASGVAGASANTPSANGTTDASTTDGGQTSTSDNSTFGVNKTVRHTMSPAGRVRRITAAVLVNDIVDHKLVAGKWVDSPRKRSVAQLKQLQELAQAVLGTDPQRGDVVTLEDITFDDGHTPETPPTLIAKVRQGASDFATPVRYAALAILFLLVYALIFRPTQKQILTTMRELAAGKPAPDTLAAPLPTQQIADAASADGVTAEFANPALKRQLAELVHAEPVAMTRTVQAWLHEETV